MNRADITDLLATRAALTSQPYGDKAIDAWHAALEHVNHLDAKRALLAVARAKTTITPADITAELKRELDAADRAARRRVADAKPTEQRDCGCPRIENDAGHPKLCEHEIARGRANIARIRTQMANRQLKLTEENPHAR